MSINAKLAIGVLAMGAAIAYIAYLGASTSWKYYVLVDECAVGAEQFRGKQLRVSGVVAPGSLKIAGDRRQAEFVLRGDEHRLPVVCGGPLPDNLAESVHVVVEGTLQSDNSLRGERVLTRCASKYAAEDQR
jgi:cytochrome c-type biogenesis protein CcmE